MLHWTILSEQDVWQGMSDGERTITYREIARNDVTLVVAPLDNGKGRMERLISPRATDYLKPEWQPGAIVSLS